MASRLPRGPGSSWTAWGRLAGLNFSPSLTLRAILRDDKPEARKFKKWVTAEVLPSIRKTGAYAVQKPATVEKASATVERDESTGGALVSIQ